MKTRTSIIAAVTLSAGFVYMADPGLGKRRRALVRDAAIHGAKVFGRAVNITARDRRIV